MARCRHKLGLLSLRDCGIEQETNCSECGKPVCKNHYRTHEEKPFCIECYLKIKKNSKDIDQDNDLQQERIRNSYYHQYAFIPFYRTGYYNDYDDDYESDYESFDSDIDDEIEYEYDDDIEIDDFQDS